MQRPSRQDLRFATLLFGLCVVMCATGCSTSMTSMTDARAYEPAEVQVVANYQVNAHGNVVGKVIDGAVTAEEEFGRGDEPISEEAYRDWVDTVLAVGLFRPATGPELMARIGVTDRVMEGIDVGLRTNFNIYKGEVKLQLWESEDTMQAISVMGGYAYHRSVANSLISYVTLTDFGRMDFDLQMLWGLNFRDIVKINLAPHFIFSRVSAEQKIPDFIDGRLPEEVKQYDPSQLFQNEWIGYYGMNSTVMLGYKYVFLAVDTGFFWMNFKPEILGEQRDFSGPAVSLAGGLSVHYPF